MDHKPGKTVYATAENLISAAKQSEEEHPTMKLAHLQPHLIMTILISTFLSAGCATTPVISQSTTVQISDVERVFLVPPVLEYIDSETGKPIDLNDPADDTLRASLLSGLRSGLEAKHVAVTQGDEFPGLDSRCVDDLGSIYRVIRLPSSLLNADQQECLSTVAATSSATHILFWRCRLFAGPGYSWNPMTGAITSESSRVVLECHLYDIRARRVAWTRATQVRDSTADAQSNISGMIDLLLTTLEVE
jgi:hypothetical protein